MNDTAAVETEQIYDKGIEEGAAKLTPERIQQVYKQMMNAEAGEQRKPTTEATSCGRP